MKIYNIIGGVNGAGKSSLTGSLKYQRSDLGSIIDVDKITAQLGGDPLAGGKVAIAKIRDCMEKGSALRRKQRWLGTAPSAPPKKRKKQDTISAFSMLGWIPFRKA